MKNFKVLMQPNEILEYVGNLWVTPEFKDSHQSESGYVRKVIETFSKHPRIFFEMTDDELERGHFTSWMNAVAHRHYENPAIQDLYYFHEILHASTMRYNGELEFSRWKGKMIENEIEVSLDSEVFIYHHLPTLREKSFPFKIWADSIEIKGDLVEARKYLKKERVRIYKNPKPENKPELEISKYHKQNEEWAKIWKDNYLEIEKTMAKFYDLSEKDKTEAVHFLTSWIEKHLAVNQNICPFLKEAKLMARLYWRNKNGI